MSPTVRQDRTVGDDRGERTVEPTRGDSETRDRPTAAFDRWRAETERTLEDADAARIDVYVRSMLPPPGAKEGQTAVLERLLQLCEQSVIGDVAVNVWGERICLCDTCTGLDTGQMLRDTVRELQRWGGEYNASARPFFERRRQGSSVTGNEYEGITPPRVTCALTIDGRLRGVFPAEFDEQSVSVQDFYEAIAATVDRDRHAETGDESRPAPEQSSR